MYYFHVERYILIFITTYIIYTYTVNCIKPKLVRFELKSQIIMPCYVYYTL